MGRPATLKIDITADARGVGKGVGDATSKLGGLGKLAGPVGLAVGAGLAVAAGAAIKFGSQAIKAASDVEQAYGAVESVFGKAADQVKRYAENAATNVGLAKSEYAGLASLVGTQLQRLGQSQDESARSTDKLIGLGADLAATFGGSVSDAVSAVGSLLKGERDPIERYGVGIKQADVNARLASQGLDKLTGAGRATAEGQATLALLFEQTKNAQGAFGREANTLAGTQERLRAKFTDVKAELGERLLPIVTRFGTYLLNEGVPALERFGRFIVSNKDTFIVFGATIGEVLLTIVQGFLKYYARQLETFANITAATRQYLTFFFGFADSLLAAAGKAFGWLPGIGPKIDTARGQLGALAASADSKLGTVEAGFRLASAAAGRAADKVGDVKSALSQLKDRTINLTVVERTVSIAQRDGRGGGLTAHAELSFGRPRLAAAGLGALTTAALGEAFGAFELRDQRVTGGLTVLDQRTIDARSFVDAVLLDDRAVSRLERAQRDNATRLGATTAYGLS